MRAGVVIAADERIAEKAAGTLADGLPVATLALGVLATRILLARVENAVAIGIAFVIRWAAAHGPVPRHGAACVGSARS